MFVLAVWQCWSQAQLNPETHATMSESTSTPSSIIFLLWAGIRSPPPHVFGHLIGFHLDDRLLIVDSQMSLLPPYTEKRKDKKKMGLATGTKLSAVLVLLLFCFLIIITVSAAESLLLLICKLIINTTQADDWEITKRLAMGCMQSDYKEMLCCICQALCQVQQMMDNSTC